MLVDLVGGQPQGLHPARIELDSDFPADAAAARHLRDTGNRQQPLGDVVVDEPGQFGRRHRCGRHRVVRDGAAIDVDPLNDRFQDALRQIVAHLGDRVAHIRHRAVDRRPDLEFHEDVGGALENVGGDVVNVADARNRALDLLRDLSLHLRRRGAGLRDGDIDHRKRNIGIQVDGQSNERHQAQEEQYDEQDDGRDGMAYGPGGNVIHEGPPSLATGLTASPSCRKAPAVATTASLFLTPSEIVTPLPAIPDTWTARRSILFCGVTMRT